MATKQNKRVLKDIEAALKLFPKVVKQKEKAYREREKVLKNFAPLSRQLLKMTQGELPSNNKLHPWRRCPAGQHWVSSHPLHVPVSEKSPTGMTTRDGHCRTNPSHRDQLYSDEIMAIAAEHFNQVKELPTQENLGKANANDFDHLIGGWTKYWNEVLRTSTPLDPNLVKALISTESDFKVSAKALASPGNWARGLMQVTDDTLAILKNEKGELKDFLVNIDQGDVHDPNLNICAGIRWLFHKKALLEKRKRRLVSWEETVMDYKGYSKGIRNKEKKAVTQWNKFLTRYEMLKK